MTEQEIEQTIQNQELSSPRLTPEDIENAILSDEYFVFDDGLTVCRITLKNGYAVIGDSACISPQNYDQALCRKIARDRAREKIWPLEGYRMKDRIYTEICSGIP